MLSTIQGKVLAFFVAFLLLLAGIAVPTLTVLSDLGEDGFIVNLAGRQRMLTQKMTKEALQLANYAFSGEFTALEAQKTRLQHTMRVFETSLYALRDGGPAPTDLEMTHFRDSPSADTDTIRQQLDEVVGKWTPFKKHLNTIVETDGKSATSVAAVIGANLPLLESMNNAVDLMQRDAERKVSQLYTMQWLAILLGLALGGIGAWIARTTIVQPVARLAEAARLMSTGNLNIEVRTEGTREIADLSDSFDRMRASMLAALDNAGTGAGRLSMDDL